MNDVSGITAHGLDGPTHTNDSLQQSQLIFTNTRKERDLKQQNLFNIEVENTGNVVPMIQESNLNAPLNNNTNDLSNLSSIMGSFHIGRESDLNEDRVISKETCDALIIQKLNNKSKENEIYVPSENTTHSNNDSILVSLQQQEQQTQSKLDKKQKRPLYLKTKNDYNKFVFEEQIPIKKT